MHITDWQTIVAIVILSGAAFLVMRRMRDWAAGTGESGCSSCPSKSDKSPAIKTRPLVQIDLPNKPR